jgi:hypothetical protein
MPSTTRTSSGVIRTWRVPPGSIAQGNRAVQHVLDPQRPGELDWVWPEEG